MLLEDGSLYITGDNSQNQCGISPAEKHLIGWHLVPGEFIDVACCWESTFVINKEREVLSCGSGLKGELGLGMITHQAELNKVMKLESTNVSIHCCLHNVCVRDGSRLYGWGSNTKCQLLEPKSRYFNTPTLLYDGSDIANVCLGKNFLCFVDGGELIVRGGITDHLSTILQDFKNYQPRVELKAMWSSLHMLTSDGICSYGQGNHGQIFKDKLPKPITHWATGSEHGILCVNQKDVLCWGWGEHGNCGRIAQDTEPHSSSENDYSNNISPLNLVYTCSPGSGHDYDSNSEIYQCYGGCASTWICVRYK